MARFSTIEVASVLFCEGKVGENYSGCALRYSLTYSARILALILTTILGFAFAFRCVVLVRIFIEMPTIIMREDLIVAASTGLGFIGFATLYVFLVRKTSPKRSSE
jgi:hypothetical protein